MVLDALLASTHSPADIDSAFQAYDEVRRPRTRRIVESSRVTGLVMCGEDGLDVGTLRAALGTRWEFIYGLGMGGHKGEARVAMERVRKGEV